MMSQTYQDWGRFMRMAGYKSGGSDKDMSMWSGIFGSTYQEPLDVRPVIDPIRSIMEVKAGYSMYSQVYGRRYSPDTWKLDKEGNPQMKFEKLPLWQAPQQVAAWAAEAVGQEGGWSARHSRLPPCAICFPRVRWWCRVFGRAEPRAAAAMTRPASPRRGRPWYCVKATLRRGNRRAVSRRSVCG